MKISKVRDLTLVEINDEKVLVVACDSCGSIGLKEGDVLKVPPYFTGRFTARVTILEVMSTGADIVTIADAVCCEMNPTGEDIMRGIKEELKAAEISDIVLTGSTEENFPTFSTGLGVTTIGIVDKNKIKLKNVCGSSSVIVVGIPKVGNEINLEKDEEIVRYSQLKKLLEDSSVFEIVPCGSKGIQYEAEALAEENGLQFKLIEDIKVDVKRSCGPATVIIAAVATESVPRFLKEINNSSCIGYLMSEQ
jgi:hypothetical protein